MTTRPRPPRAAMDFSRVSMCVHRGMTNHGHVYEHMDSTYRHTCGVGLSLRPEVDSERRASCRWRSCDGVAAIIVCVCVCVCVCISRHMCIKTLDPFSYDIHIGSTLKKSARDRRARK